MTPRIEEIRIFGLFGYLDHVIPMHPGGITFIHGPNGCGKTTVLKLIAAVFDWKPNILASEHFSKVEIVNEDKTVLTVTKILAVIEGELFDKPRFKSLVFSSSDASFDDYTLSADISEVRIAPSDIEEYVPGLYRSAGREWTHKRTGRRYDYNEVLKLYSESFTNLTGSNAPEWLTGYVSSVSLHFIKTQRLLSFEAPANPGRRPRTEESVTEVIQMYSIEIKELISRKLAEQAAASQLYDRSFPERLLSLPYNTSNSEESIRTLYAETESKIQKLVDAGLMDQQRNIPLPTKKLEETEKKVLSLYLDDVVKKLSVFDDLQKKIEIFLDIVSPKLKTKKFAVTRQAGFWIESLREPGYELDPSQLSSGEQHQIVLFYELIFKAEPNAFFLVDEPEISWHVDWQRSFIPDIHKIALLGNRSFLVATHSPQIIGNHRDLAVPLEEGIL